MEPVFISLAKKALNNWSPKYDYLLVGAGLFNAIFVMEAAKTGKHDVKYSKTQKLAHYLFVTLAYFN